MKNKVEVQKGAIIANPMTMKQMTHSERIRERVEEIKTLRRGQTLDLKTPQKKK